MLETRLPVVSSMRGSLARLGDVLDSRTSVIAIPVAPPIDGENDVQPRRGVADVAALYRLDLAEIAARENLNGSVGEARSVIVTHALGAESSEKWKNLPERIVFVGVGDESPKALRGAGAALARAAQPDDRIVTTIAGDSPMETTRAFVEGFLLGSHRFQRHGASQNSESGATELVVVGRHGEPVLTNARIGAEATTIVRDLANEPSNIKSPQWMVEQARKAVSGVPNISITAWGERRLAAEGFGGILAVGSGSEYESRFVMIDYTPQDVGRHIALVGKGITYDTGGLSIKPRESMVSMKTDMAGAAVVLAAVVGAARLGIRHRVTALLPLAENAFGGSSFRPGDVITCFGGRTVEIANTDAEGRLVLADALAYANEMLDPDIIVDIATLTGAASLGLGKQYGALYSSDDRLADALTSASGLAGEPVWRMPLVEDYLPALESTIADLRHVPEHTNFSAGSVTAALFLREFVGTRRWAHVDIAGPARAAKDHLEISEGATGYGARLLVRYLENMR